MDKLQRLRDILKRMGSVLVAYSGGVDSTFLLRVAQEVLGDKVLAVTAISPTYPAEELDFSKRMTRALGVRHKIIKTAEFKDKNFIANPVNRCYFCKRELFRHLKRLALKSKLNFVVDASNLSDKKDFRPGNIAKQELKIHSPLQAASLNKQDIRKLSKRLGLITWNKPSLACLASRIPYGKRISPPILKRIHQAETSLKQLGFNTLRIRHYNGLCRIEVPKADIPKIIKRQKQVVTRLKQAGYNFITVDLEGYRSGSMNPTLPKNSRLNIVLRKSRVNEVLRKVSR